MRSYFTDNTVEKNSITLPFDTTYENLYLIMSRRRMNVPLIDSFLVNNGVRIFKFLEVDITESWHIVFRKTCSYIVNNTHDREYCHKLILDMNRIMKSNENIRRQFQTTVYNLWFKIVLKKKN